VDGGGGSEYRQAKFSFPLSLPPSYPHPYIHKFTLTLTSVILPASPPLRTTTMVLLLPFLSRGGERAISTSFLLLRSLVLPPASASTSMGPEGPIKAMLWVVCSTVYV